MAIVSVEIAYSWRIISVACYKSRRSLGNVLGHSGQQSSMTRLGVVSTKDVITYDFPSIIAIR